MEIWAFLLQMFLLRPDLSTLKVTVIIGGLPYAHNLDINCFHYWDSAESNCRLCLSPVYCNS